MSIKKTNILITKARVEDIAAIVRLLADDVLGSKREDLSLPLRDSYLKAFYEIENNHYCFLIVAKNNDTVLGTMQVTLMPGISRKGMLRAEIEGVRVDKNYRGNRIGLLMLNWAINKAKEHHCGLIQLTSDKKRILAQNFYEKSGFVASHTGMKMFL